MLTATDVLTRSLLVGDRLEKRPFSEAYFARSRDSGSLLVVKRVDYGSLGLKHEGMRLMNVAIECVEKLKHVRLFLIHSISEVDSDF